MDLPVPTIALKALRFRQNYEVGLQVLAGDGIYFLFGLDSFLDLGHSGHIWTMRNKIWVWCPMFGLRLLRNGLFFKDNMNELLDSI